MAKNPDFYIATSPSGSRGLITATKGIKPGIKGWTYDGPYSSSAEGNKVIEDLKRKERRQLAKVRV